MHTFRVWAPSPKTLDVVIGGNRTPMLRGQGNWWSAGVPDAAPGTDYFYSVDGGDPVPDPRSSWQPEGVNGPSRIVDHSRFQWTDLHWQAPPLASAIIYELHIGTFTPEGTFRSAMACLEHLVQLGVTHVELLPVNEFPGKWGWGYDGVDLYAPHHAYGAPGDLKAFVDACHGLGLAVLLDVVYNHFGPAGNYLDRFGPYFTDAYNTPWGPAVNLDHAGSPEVRRFFADNALMWMRDYHFDGLRLDAVHAFIDRSAIHFLEFLSAEVDMLSSRIGRHLILIAESDLNDPRVVTPREAGGLGMDAQWSDDFHHALHAVLTGETNGYYEDFGAIADLAKALRSGFVADGGYSKHRDSVHGRPIVRLSGHRFLAYSQNHDQVGNRAQGERLSHLAGPGAQKIAAALVLTAPFTPMLFQGEEFAASTPFQYFTQHEDEELGRKVSEGRRSEFQAFGWKPEDVPDPQSRDTFNGSKLKWNDLHEQPHASVLEWYTKLIALRRSSLVLNDGRMEDVEVRFDERARWLSMRRGNVQVVCNFSTDRQAVAYGAAPVSVLCSEEGHSMRPGMIEIPGTSAAVLLS